MARKKRNIFDLLRNFDEETGIFYSEDEIRGAIETLPPDVKEKLKAVYGNDYDEVVENVYYKISRYVATSVIPKLKKILKEGGTVARIPNPLEQGTINTPCREEDDALKQTSPHQHHTIVKRKKNYTNPNVLPDDASTSLDPLLVIKEVIKTKTLSEVEDYLTQEEAILLILRLGISKLGTYEPNDLAKMFHMSVDEVEATLKLASDCYVTYLDNFHTKEMVKK